MTVKDSLSAAMSEMVKDPRTIFVGYGLKSGRANGTLKGVPDSQLLETTVSEQLMVGLAIGLSLKGRKAVVFVERMDFLLLALDGVVNHLDKVAKESRGEFKPGIILRVCVGNSQKPLFTGSTHTGDFTKAMQHMVSFPVIRMMHGDQVMEEYRKAHAKLPTASTMLVEYKDYYQ